MLSEKREKIVTGLKKCHGMLDKLEKMVEEWKPCADIAQQINATMGLLRSASTTLLENHLQTCGVSKVSSGDPQSISDFTQEVMKVWSLTQKN